MKFHKFQKKDAQEVGFDLIIEFLAWKSWDTE